MARAAREQSPDQRMHRPLIALDQIAPRALIAALRTTKRSFVERLVGASSAAACIAAGYHPRAAEKFHKDARFLASRLESQASARSADNPRTPPTASANRTLGSRPLPATRAASSAATAFVVKGVDAPMMRDAAAANLVAVFARPH